MKTKFSRIVLMLFITAVIASLGNLVVFHKANPDASFSLAPMIDSLPGMAFLYLLALAGVLCKRHIPCQLPAAAYIVTIGCIITIPGVPYAEEISKMVAKVNFMALCTPILAYAGLSLAKDLDVMKRSGWKLVFLAVFVFLGTFLGSAIIADTVLKAMGQV